MVRKVWFGLGVTLLLIAGIVAVGVLGFNMGMARGVAQNIDPAQLPAAMPYAHHWMPGMGLLMFGLPLLLAFLFFGAVKRMLFFGFVGHRLHHWGGPRGWGGPRHWEGEGTRPVPPFAEEWHRKMHEEPGSSEKKD